jgi:capsular polysaccharide biosynthesis protein
VRITAPADRIDAVPRLPTALLPWWPQVKTAYTRYTRIVSPVSQQIARLSDHGGPRGVVGTAAEAVANAGPDARTWVVRSAEHIDRPMPAGDPVGDYRFAAAQQGEVAAASVSLLPDARVDGRFGAVISADHRLISEYSQYFGIGGPREHPAFLRPLRSTPREYEGVVAVLGDRGDDNYYHFIVDVLPKLGMLADCPGLPLPDAYYVPMNRGFQRQLLERAGIPLDRVIDSRTTPYLRAKQLIVPGLPDAHLQAPHWVLDWLQSTMLQGAGDGRPRRLYLTRGQTPNTRIVRNEEEVIEALRPLGFEVFDCGAQPVAAQIAAFADAESIVAPHGASLANLAFTTGDTAVVEMFPPTYVNTCYWALSRQLAGIDYRYLLGVGAVPPGDPQSVADDLTVDVERLLDLLGEQS